MGKQYILQTTRDRFDAEESSSAGAARHGIRSGWIATLARVWPLDPLSG